MLCEEGEACRACTVSAQKADRRQAATRLQGYEDEEVQGYKDRQVGRHMLIRLRVVGERQVRGSRGSRRRGQGRNVRGR